MSAMLTSQINLTQPQNQVNQSAALNPKQSKPSDADINKAQKQQMEAMNKQARQYLRSCLDELSIPMPNSEDDQKELIKLLGIVGLPNVAQGGVHRNANMLGQFDIDNTGDPKQKIKRISVANRCNCCTYVQQKDPIPNCTSIMDIGNMGRSTFLYFQTITSLSVLLVVLLLVYSGYALATNVLASNKFKGEVTTANVSAALDYLSISLGSKQTNQTATNSQYYFIQCWLGVATVIIWFLVMFILKYYEKKRQDLLDIQTNTPSDFTAVIEGLPANVTEKQLQDQLDIYYKSIPATHRFPQVKRKHPFKIRKMCVGIPFFIQDMEDNSEIKQIESEIYDIREKLKSYINERQGSQSFSSTKKQREETVEQLKAVMEKARAKQQKLGAEKNKAVETASKSGDATVVFVSFECNYAKQFFCYLNQNTMSARIRNLVSCCSDSGRFAFRRETIVFSVRIEEAPQPEDVIWTNLGVSDFETYKRRFITYFATCIMLGLSFLAIYGLTDAQNKGSSNRYLSILISVVLTVINIVIGIIIRKLTAYERDYTLTRMQATLAVKSILAQLLNSIVVPVVTSYVISKNLYQQGGLTDNIFMLGLTTAFMPPLLKYFDIMQLVNALLRCWKARPSVRLGMNQREFNIAYQKPEFEVGFEYIYIVNLFLFSCYYCSLHPIVVSFSVVGLLLMYWVQKHCLFNRMRRPVPGTSIVNTAMWQLIFIGPLAYTLGSFTWSNFIPGGIPIEAFIPNLIAAAISILIFIFPYRLVFGLFMDEQSEPLRNYDECRMEFTTEYDRVNPATFEEGRKDYEKYLTELQQKMKNAKPEEKQKMAERLLMAAQPRPAPQMSYAASPYQYMMAPPQPAINGFNLAQMLAPQSMPMMNQNNNYARPAGMAAPMYNPTPAYNPPPQYNTVPQPGNYPNAAPNYNYQNNNNANYMNNRGATFTPAPGYNNNPMGYMNNQMQPAMNLGNMDNNPFGNMGNMGFGGGFGSNLGQGFSNFGAGGFGFGY